MRFFTTLIFVIGHLAVVVVVIEIEKSSSQDTSALRGRTRLWPHQREIADAISDPTIERVRLAKPVRVGFTTLLTAATGSFVVNEPCPVLLLEPTESDCRDAIVSDVEPPFAATPALANVLTAEADETGRNALQPDMNTLFARPMTPRNRARRANHSGDAFTLCPLGQLTGSNMAQR